MIKNRLCWALLILLSAALFIYVNSYSTLIILLAVILMPLVSLVFMKIAAKGLKMEIDLPPVMEKGENTSFSYMLANASGMAIGRAAYTVKIDNQMTFSHYEEKVSSAVLGGSQENKIFEIEEPKAGITIVSTERIRVLDAFGIFAVKKADLKEAVTVVYPSLREIDIFLNEPVETLSDGHRWSQEKKGNDVSEVFGIREYEEGDEVRRIHWKLSEKMDKTMVRDYSLPLNYSIFLMLELTKQEEDVMDRALEYYVSLSRVLLEKGINHVLAWYDGGEEIFHTSELKTFGDMEIAMAQMLSACAYEEDCMALNHYLESVYCVPQTTLIYVTTQPEEDKLAELETRQAVRVINANDEDISEVWV